MDSKLPSENKQQTPDSQPKWTMEAMEDQSVEHRGISEWLRMNRYHLILVTERLKKGSKVPCYSDAWPWAGTFFAFLLAMATTDCKSFLGLSADTWQAIFIIATLLSFGVTTNRLIQAFIHRKERSKTPEQEVDEIIEELAKGRDKLAKSG